MEPIRSHDALFRFVFGEPEQMAELLSGCLPPALVAAIRWPTLHRLPDTFVDRVLEARRGDLFFAVELAVEPLGDREPTGDGGTADNPTLLLQVLTEHKAQVDRFAALQLAGYAVRLLEAWLEQRPEARTLPALLTFVLHHGDRPWSAPTSVHELVDARGWSPELTAVLAPRQLRLPFVLLDLATFDELRIDAMWSSAVMRLVARFLQFLPGIGLSAMLDELERWRALLVQVLRHPRGRDLSAALLSWYLGRDPEDTTTMRDAMNKIENEEVPMRTMLDAVLDMGEERGRKKSEARGAQQGMQELLRGQLQARFGPLSPEADVRLAAADAATLQRWSLRILTAARLDEVLVD
jgi:hypothetical protein